MKIDYESIWNAFSMTAMKIYEKQEKIKQIPGKPLISLVHKYCFSIKLTYDLKQKLT